MNGITPSLFDLSSLIAGTGSEGTPSECLLATQLRSLCERGETFCLVNHAIPSDLIASTFMQSNKFFTTLTSDQKRSALAVRGRGYIPMAEELLDPTTQTRGGTKESYFIGSREKVEKQDEDGSESCKNNVGFNVWPSGELLPGWKHTMQTFYRSVYELGAKLRRLLALSLGLEATFFEHDFTKPSITMRLLHYSEEKSDVANGVMGCGAHTDFSMFTLILADNVSGLEIFSRQEDGAVATAVDEMREHVKQCNNGCIMKGLGSSWVLMKNYSSKSSYHLKETDCEDSVAFQEKINEAIATAGTGSWIKLGPTPGKFLFVIGDMLQHLTNDTYRSTIHRVVNREGKARLSIPVFFEPNRDAVIDCLPSFCSAERPANYVKTTAAAFYRNESRYVHLKGQ